MPEIFFAGGDWSGTPDKPSGAVDIYSVCVAAFSDVDLLNEASERVRLQLGIKRDEEFHGHQMSDVAIAAVLEMALELDVRLGILIVNKAAVPLSGVTQLPAPNQFAALLALRLLTRFLPLVPIKKLWIDEDIQAKPAQKKFETAVSRLNREVGASPKIKTSFLDSRRSRLIQIADVYAYAMTRQIGGAKIQPELENVLRKIRADSRHLILGPMPWEE